MKILKLFAWEPAMTRQLNEKRRTELYAVRLNMLMGGIMSFVFTALPLVVTASSFALFSIPGAGKTSPDNPEGKLTAAIAYTALSLFQVRPPSLTFHRLLSPSAAFSHPRSPSLPHCSRCCASRCSSCR